MPPGHRAIKQPAHLDHTAKACAFNLAMPYHGLALRRLALILLSGAAVTTADSLPYNPTRVLTTTNLSFAYILQPSTQNANQAMLSTLDVTQTISTSQLNTVALNSTLSFLRDDTAQAYTPIVDASGNLTIITGDCSSSSAGLEAWRFIPQSSSQAKGGSWTQVDVTGQQAGAQAGANYLASGIAFSSDVGGDAADTQLYTFGGMCPFANATTQNWTSAATYSSSIVAFSAKASGDEVTAYEVDVGPSTGGPIPEAGFSMTGLAPTYSTDASGAPKTMQQDFLLIGGHTQTAFINMSSVAVYSLPQESWAFLPVLQPASVKSDLAIRQSNTVVEPRSGHTAVLSEDGESIIVVGGWVGDVSNPATPQLAVLSLGSGYGGTGEGQEWSWYVPEPTGSGPAAGSGIYGHGATLLPGGVMMVVGGYTIPASSSSRHKRQTAQANPSVYLYNTSSNTWLTSYTPSSNDLPDTSSHSDSGPLSKTSEQVGLGVGLGVGLLLLLALIIFYIWYSRRLKRKRREREARLTARPLPGSLRHYDQAFLDQGGIDGRGGQYHAIEGQMAERDRVPSGGYNSTPQMEQAGSTGLFVDIPSPTRGLRKGLANRPYSYHAAPRYDDGRMSRGSNYIHPIVEQDDEDDHEELATAGEFVGLSESERQLRAVERVLTSGSERRAGERQSVQTPSPTTSNPFADPSSSPNPLGSHPVLVFDEEVVPGGTVRRVPTVVSQNPEGSPSRRPLLVNADEASNWIAYQDAEDAGEHRGGRASPSKTDDRTSSTLSERSHASTNSMTRTMSTRTGALLSGVMAAWRAADVPETSPTEERSNPMNYIDDQRSQRQNSTRSRPRSTIMDANYLVGIPQAGKSTDSFMTARTSFVQLQSEGEALLGGARRDDPYQRALAAQSSTKPGSSSTAAVARSTGATTPVPLSARRQGWMGSLRRALNAISGSERSNSMLTSSSTSHDDLFPDLTARTGNSSPTRSHRAKTPSSSSGADSSGPRRTVSDGGALLLSHKRGQRDWDAEAEAAAAARREASAWGEPRSAADAADSDDDDNASLVRRRGEEEWDVEGAANRRDVQVMFTVPKTRLRVVNADVERASMRSASDGALSRANSARSEVGAAAAAAAVAGPSSASARAATLGLRPWAEPETTTTAAAAAAAPFSRGIGLAITREEEEAEEKDWPIPRAMGGEEGDGTGKGKGKQKAA